MKSKVRVALDMSPENAGRLSALQREFTAVCNALAPLVQEHRCWNRVALHHMSYRQMRQRFPSLGSQMICNAIYSVCRAARIVYQQSNSPFNVTRWPAGRPLPRLKFNDPAPVFFDRHTLSIKNGQVSMYTLDGRTRFDLDLPRDVERRFREEKLREIVLSSEAGAFSLTFQFGSGDEDDDAELPHIVVTDEPIPAADASRTLEAPTAP